MPLPGWRRLRTLLQVLTVVGAKLIETASFFLVVTFTITYLVGIGYSRTTSINAVLLAAVVAVPAFLLFGSLSDKIGRKRQFMIGTVLMGAYMIPYFWLLNLGSILALYLAVVVGLGIIYSLVGSVIGFLFAEVFPPEIRYTGASIGYQVGAAVLGGPLPLIAASLLAYIGSYVSISLFMILCALVSLVAVARIKDRTGRELDRDHGKSQRAPDGFARPSRSLALAR